jgi:hypothetical protein
LHCTDKIWLPPELGKRKIRMPLCWQDPSTIVLARSDHHRVGKIQPPRLLLPEVALQRPKLGVGMAGEVIWVSGSIFLV